MKRIILVLLIVLSFAGTSDAALVLSDVGADQILKGYFNNSPAPGNLTLKLFCNDITPADTDTAGTYTECTGGNYAAKTLTLGSWTVTVGNDPSDAVYAQQVFTFTGALTTNVIIYGYFVVDVAGVLIFSERASGTFQPANNGDHYDVTPKCQLSKGTPN